MPEIGTFGLMSGDGKRSDGHRPQATAPILDSTIADLTAVLRIGSTRLKMLVDLFQDRAIGADKMRPKLIARILFVAGFWLPLAQMTHSAFAQSDSLHLTPAQTISPADMTKTELDYYRTLDSEAGKSFIVTRSYVRLTKQVVDHKLPPLNFPPRKPEGFTAKYLLPDDPTVLNEALGEYLKAKLTADPRALGITPSK